ncbi:EscV/YscV/HrcV family type III secretion system export apparatus protein [Phyllobacterium salinisoli]|uniref:EscV/YscV/HrcV family type III secretion system export apparatus protein n=1 Tax=Phyllobacterium salinisoli TaxID=1899321 RepID=A0A368JZZ7_9HYPH|nr:type III secretion system export apparatus subunit SctV [Phyllobacterium salinisoli]RCS22726.1 EscV/YscV/HrcV family type III secretion system export apparatus protein [Phyllobacterium salinisoli]
MSTVAALNGFARRAAKRTDIVIAAFMMLAVVMMILPMPTVLVDLLIGLNIAFSLLILVVAFYISKPVQFSALPSVILLATLFRLSLSITTTRLILLQADAGQIVSAFGEFVIAGQVIIGLVVFLVITIAQFVVITKGAERVAEVAARFTLDALPGKQMSIDNEARNGDIDQDEARQRRRNLERESQFYGAMDGAMKFVKGDAIAGLIIIIVNLVGGLFVGMLQHDMRFSEAAETYSLLSVGDGLIAQIPALLIAVGSGVVVTRVASEHDQDLGSEIVGQLIADSRALALAAVLLFAMGFVPGFPTLVFFGLGAGAGGLAYLIHRRDASRTAGEQEPETLGEVQETNREDEMAALSSKPSSRLIAWVGRDLAAQVHPQLFRQLADRARHDLLNDLGVSVPAIDLRVDPRSGGEEFRIDLEGVPVISGAIPTGYLLLTGDPVDLDLMKVPYRRGPTPAGDREAVWVEEIHAEALREAGIGFEEPSAVLTHVLADVLRRYASHFIGLQETRLLLMQIEEDYGDLVKEAVSVASLQKISEVLRRLVEEDVPIGNLRVILEAIVEWGPRVQTAYGLVEHARVALARQISHRNAEMNRVISAYVLTRHAEDAMRAALERGEGGGFAGIPEQIAKPIVEQIRQYSEKASPDAVRAVLISMDIRRHLRNLLVRNEIRLPVLSYQEIASEFSVQSLGAISLPPPPPLRQIRSSEPAASPQA